MLASPFMTRIARNHWCILIQVLTISYVRLACCFCRLGYLWGHFLTLTGNATDYLQSYEGKELSWRKTSQSREENQQNEDNPHMKLSMGIEPGARWWEASALTSEPSQLSLHRCLLYWKQKDHHVGDKRRILRNQDSFSSFISFHLTG